MTRVPYLVSLLYGVVGVSRLRRFLLLVLPYLDRLGTWVSFLVRPQVRVLPSHVVVPGHRLLYRPSSNVFKVPTRMESAEIRPIIVILVAVFGIQAEGEYSNIALTHEIHSQSLDAVVWSSSANAPRAWLSDLPGVHTDMALHVFLVLGLGDIAVLVFVVVFVDGLPDQVQAVQLVEDLHGRSIAFFARIRVLDLQRIFRES